MKSQKIKVTLKDIPIYEHLEYGIKCSYAESLAWLEEVNKFFRLLKKNKNYPHWPEK